MSSYSGVKIYKKRIWKDAFVLGFIQSSFRRIPILGKWHPK